MAEEDEVNGMDIEVDPKLFITCRLCLEEMGQYQIVPILRRQIKFCFDITVEQFDGLPQLLCRECKALLTEYYTHKNSFIHKQEALIKKLKACKEENNTNQSSFQSETNVDNHSIIQESEDTDLKCDKVTPLKIDKKRINRLDSATSADSIQSNNTNKSIKVTAPYKRKRNSKKRCAWKKNYVKRFHCNLCTKSYKSKYKLMKHIQSHSKLKSQYRDVFRTRCMVGLTKIDDKPNSTGVQNTIMFDKNKIIEDFGSIFYHVSYKQDPIDSTTNNVGPKDMPSSDSSDDEVFVVKKKRRVHRLSSRSSNDTVVIERNDNKSPETVDVKHEQIKDQPNIPSESNVNTKDSECIHIDDSSDSSNIDFGSYKNTKLPKEPKVDCKTIENIISVCLTKYLKKMESSPNDNNATKSAYNIDYQLKHKVLSIGRKILNKDSIVPCVGLLRYMEHKNLDVVWLPKSQVQTSAGKENFIRIMAKARSNNNILDNKSHDEESGWIDIPVTAEDITCTFDLNTASISVADICENEASSTSVSESNAPHTTVQEQVPTFKTASPVILRNAPIYADIQSLDADSSSKKLLNQSPVANPKQLPKKTSANDMKSHNVSKAVLDSTGKESILLELDDVQNYEAGMIMPVITSTTSLAKEGPEDTDETPDSSVAKAPEKSVPRIKVKPASELMKPASEFNAQHSNSANTIRNSWAIHAENRTTVPNLIPVPISISSLAAPAPQTIKIVPKPNVMPVQRVSSEPKKKSDFIILDTIEMPNTKTDSPFTYFKNLLYYHKIVFFDTDTPPTARYICLLKFKVQFKQENKNIPVTLCLSLYCLENLFRICIKDCNQISIDIFTISANWQWEIIKIFQGDVSNKILQNAQKIGQEVYNYTKTFLFLLKSINCIQETRTSSER